MTLAVVVDLPPGTGDIPITVCQEAAVAGAVIVTTPHPLAFPDVAKGVEMLHTLNVRPLAVVENMAYLDCGCGTRHTPFGVGHRERLVQEYGIRNSFRLPLEAGFAEPAAPFALAAALPHMQAAVDAITAAVVRDIEVARATNPQPPLIDYDPARRLVVVTPLAGDQVAHDPVQLRRACRSAGNVPANVRPDVHPLAFTPKGNYAIEVRWSDGHTSIFPYDRLLLPTGPSK